MHAGLAAEHQVFMLKAARCDAQNADATLRAKIELLKGASEKHAAAEHRARQKMCALQEAAKQVVGATPRASRTRARVSNARRRTSARGTGRTVCAASSHAVKLHWKKARLEGGDRGAAREPAGRGR